MSYKTVFANKKVMKSLEELSDSLRDAFYLLMREIQESGPVRGNWPNYGKLGNKLVHHCHLKKGKPTYVAIWKKTDKDTVAFLYIGTHENADYDKYK